MMPQINSKGSLIVSEALKDIAENHEIELRSRPIEISQVKID